MADTEHSILDEIIAASGPIEPHLAALASEVNLPDYAIAQCTLRIGEVADTLRAVVAKAADGDALSDDESRLLIRGLFILGGRRDPGSFPVFLRLLCRPEAELIDLLDEVLAVRLAPLLSGMFDGDTEALLGLARDAACAEDVRLSAMDSAAFLTFDGRIPRERMRAFLADFAREPYAKGDVVWLVWADAIARLGLRDLAPLVHAALADGRIARATMRKQQFDKDLAAAEAAPEDASAFADACYIRDTIEALDWSRTGEVSKDGSLGADWDAPIEMHLAALGELSLPDVALETCVERFEEAAPALRALLDRAAAGRPLSEAESLRLFRGLFVLAAARDTEAFPSVLRLLRRPARETEQLLGEAVSGSLPSLLVSLFDDEAEPLLAIVADASLDEVLRGTALEAATFLAWEGRIDREELRALLVAFYEKRMAADETYVWYAWMMAVALLNFGDLVPMVEAAWKARRIDHDVLEWSDFKTDLARARTAWDDIDRFELSAAGYIDDVVAELEWTRHWTEEDAVGSDDAWAPPVPETPVINPLRNVGRNDPCPCGSGKKYKKCCLANG